MKKVLLGIMVAVLSSGIVFADAITDVTTDVNNIRSTGDTGLFGNIVTTIFNTTGKIQAEFLEITSYWQQTGSNIWFSTGNVGIGDSSASNKLTVTGLGDINGANSGGGILLQDSASSTSGSKLRLDVNEMQSNNNGTASSFSINPFGGNIYLGGGSNRLMFNASNGNVGLGTTNPTQKLDVRGNVNIGGKIYSVVTDNIANATVYGLNLDQNMTGSDTLTNDRNHIGLRLDIDSNATGGNTSNEHRVYGTYSDVDVSGDSDFVAGGRFDATTNHSAGTISSQMAVGGYAQSNGSAPVSYMYGTYGSAVSASIGAVGSMYGARARALKTSSSTENTNNMIGTEGEVELSGGSLNNAFGVRSLIDRNAGSITNGYLFYGDYQGTLPSNPYGIYIADPVKNYFAGDIGIGTNNPGLDLEIKNTASEHKLRLRSDNGDYYTDFVKRTGSDGRPHAFDIYNKSNGAWNHGLTILNNGNVGIGTTNPSAKLHVAGNIRADMLKVTCVGNCF